MTDAADLADLLRAQRTRSLGVAIARAPSDADCRLLEWRRRAPSDPAPQA